MKKAAGTLCAARVSRTRSVAVGFGPSSKVRYAVFEVRGPRPITRPNSQLFG
jgi:hypothetical protein